MSKPDPAIARGAPEELDCVVGLGSNLGDRMAQLERAASELARCGAIVAASNVYATPPLGPPQPDFLNAAVRLRTRLSPERLLERLLAIERAQGRVRRERWGPRLIDLDLLWIDGVVLETEHLRVPHPGLPERAFAILPLLDVAPAAVDPVTGASYRSLLSRLSDSSSLVLGPLRVRPLPPA